MTIAAMLELGAQENLDSPESVAPRAGGRYAPQTAQARRTAIMEFQTGGNNMMNCVLRREMLLPDISRAQANRFSFRLTLS